MNDELNTDEFESWLKNQTDKHRMYPSDQLWRNINQQLHGNSRWPALTFGAILTGALVTAALIFLRPDKDLFNLPVVADVQPHLVTITNHTTTESNIPQVDIQALRPLNTKEVLYSFNYPVKNYPSNELQTSTGEVDVLPENETLELNEPISIHSVNATPAITGNVNKAKLVITEMAAAAPEQPATIMEQLVTKEDVEETKINNIVSESIDPTEQTFMVDKSQIRLPEHKKSRWNIELYGGPSINYRRLTEKRPYDYHLPYNSALTTANRSIVNNVVKQRPSIGFNVGTAIAYALSNRLKIKVGLQFNYRQYTIDAFRSKLERSVLLLNNGYIYPDSVYTYSVISNEPGKSALTLNNRFYQLSAPVSVEWTVLKMNNLNFSVASSLQPTYQLNANVYQITSDYKSYVQAPGLLRRWNVNAGAEANANFVAGGLQWQVGPQIRYQMMPTQNGNYSIREHLIDYGVKVGIVKQLR